MRRFTLTLLVVAACSTAAFAQDAYPPEHREWEWTGFAGGSAVMDRDFTTAVFDGTGESSRSVELDYSSGYQLGVRITQHLFDFWAADLEYSYSDQRLRFTNLLPDVESLTLDHAVHHFSYNVAYFPQTPRKRFRPYAKVGAGAALFYIPGSSRDYALMRGLHLRDSWKFMVNVGGGFKFLLDDQVAFTLDVKDRLTSVPSYGLPGVAQITNGLYQPGIAVDGVLHNWQINIGLGFQWDE